MLSSLPSLAPRDSHTLWYTSNHHTTTSTGQVDTSPTSLDHYGSHMGTNQNNGSQSQRRVHQSNLSRTPLARLRADELHMERRKNNVSNYGSSWIKPPGVMKTLTQTREEERELLEHQEAMRREQLAQELAEAEAGDGPQAELMDGDMDDARDLDDDIPEAEVTGLDAEESDNEDAENDREDIPRGVVSQRLPEDVFREAIARGGDGDSDTDAEDQSQMLQEEDLVHDSQAGQNLDMGMDMDADLDDDVPEAGGYEHTDTEEELDSSDDDDEDEEAEEDSIDMGRLPSAQQFNSSIVRSDGTQNSLDLGAMDLRSGSSNIGSSPRTRRAAR